MVFPVDHKHFYKSAPVFLLYIVTSQISDLKIYINKIQAVLPPHAQCFYWSIHIVLGISFGLFRTPTPRGLSYNVDLTSLHP